jgi:hypothetical protein
MGLREFEQWKETKAHGVSSYTRVHVLSRTCHPFSSKFLFFIFLTMPDAAGFLCTGHGDSCRTTILVHYICISLNYQVGSKVGRFNFLLILTPWFRPRFIRKSVFEYSEELTNYIGHLEEIINIKD